MSLKVALVAVCLALAAAPARGDEGEEARARARALLQEGNRYFDARLFVEALDRYRQAYAIVPSANIDFNLAQSLNELGRPLEALGHYERYVRRVKEADSPEDWKRAHEQIFRLEGLIARVEIQASVAGAEVSIDGSPVGTTPLPAPIRLVPGPHAMVVSRPGYERHVIERTLEAGETIVERVELRTEEDAAAARRALEAADARRREMEERLRRAEAEERAKRERARRALRTGGWVALGAGAASLAAAGVLAALSSRAASDVEDVAPGTPWADVRGDHDRASSYRTGAIAALVAGGALAGTGAVLVGVTGSREKAAILVSGSF
jgi:tetratricopeptide (TPR) repeat protein